ncbi:MAG: phosphate acetyltransferase [Thermovirga sp.]|nr:phosphate acetyltransferase [Thermovirga sp.]
MAKKNALISQLKDTVYKKGIRVVFPEAQEPRILEAAIIAQRDSVAVPILVGNREQALQVAHDHGLDISLLAIIDPEESSSFEKYVSLYFEQTTLREGAVRKLLKRPLFFALMMVKASDADAMVGGAVYETASIIMAGTMVVGMKEGVSTPSSFFIMDIPGFTGGEDGKLIFADCAVLPDPSAEELADIAIASAESARNLLGCVPRVAMLSFSTKGSSLEPQVEKVIQATKIARERRPDLLVDGEFQADTAIVPAIAKKKVKEESSVAGKANILIFPDLNSGNIAYKLVQRLANADAIGPLLQGFAKPICDLSRGATVEDILGSIVVTATSAIGS